MPINCSCDDTTGYRTLAELRADLIADLGWGAQVASPPPGVATYLNLQLRKAHSLLWQRFPALRTERWFTWPLTVDERFYDLNENAEQTVAPICTKELDPYSITWVGIEQDTSRYELRNGIPNQVLSQDITGWPTHYEVRQCIELWPAPDATEGTLLVRGRFKATAFSADADRCGVPDDMVYLLALANAKAHYRQPDANNYVQQMETLLDNLVGGTHGTRKYIPGARVDGDKVYALPSPSAPFA